jgi:hypothetical protein
MAARRSNGIDNYSAVISLQRRERESAAAALMNFSTLCTNSRMLDVKNATCSDADEIQKFK